MSNIVNNRDKNLNSYPMLLVEANILTMTSAVVHRQEWNDVLVQLHIFSILIFYQPPHAASRANS